jgi:Protein of unknown function (DUF4233)
MTGTVPGPGGTGAGGPGAGGPGAGEAGPGGAGAGAPGPGGAGAGVPGPGGTGAGGPGAGRRGLSDAAATRRLCTTVLIMETVVIWLAIPVALAVDHARPQRVGAAGVVLAVAAIVLAALARRRLRWAIVGGTVLQALVIAAGVIVPVMYFLGAIFAAFWVIGLRLGHRLDVAS